MMKKQRNLIVTAVALAVVLLAGVLWLNQSPAEAKAKPALLEFDVAEDATRFVFDEAPVFEDGYPAHGNSFVTVGYIYPPGTLSDSNGVNADGSPEFPDKVIGEWICRGYFIHDGAHAADGVWVITTQTYSFGTEYGEQMIVTDGYEWAVPQKVGYRAITGGTGAFAGVEGQAQQVLLGFNASGGVNTTFTLEMQKQPKVR